MATKHLNMGRTDRVLRAFVIAPIAIVAALALGATSIAGIVLFGIDTHRGGRTCRALPH